MGGFLFVVTVLELSFDGVYCYEMILPNVLPAVALDPPAVLNPRLLEGIADLHHLANPDVDPGFAIRLNVIRIGALVHEDGARQDRGAHKLAA